MDNSKRGSVKKKLVCKNIIQNTNITEICEINSKLHNIAQEIAKYCAILNPIAKCCEIGVIFFLSNFILV